MVVAICHADHVAPSICKKLALALPTSGSRSWTEAMEFVIVYFQYYRLDWPLGSARDVARTSRAVAALGLQENLDLLT
jgi:hypothetical protein